MTVKHMTTRVVGAGILRVSRVTREGGEGEGEEEDEDEGEGEGGKHKRESMTRWCQFVLLAMDTHLQCL